MLQAKINLGRGIDLLCYYTVLVFWGKVIDRNAFNTIDFKSKCLSQEPLFQFHGTLDVFGPSESCTREQQISPS